MKKLLSIIVLTVGVLINCSSEVTVPQQGSEATGSGGAGMGGSSATSSSGAGGAMIDKILCQDTPCEPDSCCYGICCNEDKSLCVTNMELGYCCTSPMHCIDN